MAIYRKGDDQFDLKRKAQQLNPKLVSARDAARSFDVAYHNKPVSEVDHPISGDDLSRGARAREHETLIFNALQDRMNKK